MTIVSSMQRRHPRTWLVLPFVLLVGQGCSDITSRDEGDRPLTADEILAVPTPTTQGFLAAYQAVRSQHAAVDSSSYRFARLVLQQLSRDGQALSLATSEVDIDDFLDRLNPYEWELVFGDVLGGSVWKGAISALHAISATQAARNDFPGPTLDDGAGDAFRHTYWNALMAAQLGTEWAEAFATAHERPLDGSRAERMDLNNNLVGRQIGQEAGLLHAASFVLDYPLSCTTATPQVDPRRIVMVRYCPTIRLRSYNGIPISFQGLAQGSAIQHEFGENIASGNYVLAVRCVVPGGTGCDYEVEFNFGITLLDDERGEDYRTWCRYHRYEGDENSGSHEEEFHPRFPRLKHLQCTDAGCSDFQMEC